MLGLPRTRRVKTGRDFARLRSDGRRLVYGCLILNWLPLSAGTTARLGVITSRKVGTAVTRSRSRRLLREAFRLHQGELNCPVDLVLVARPSIAGKTGGEVQRDYLKALELARLRKKT